MTSEMLSVYGGIFHLSSDFSRDEERALKTLATYIGPGSTPEEHRANRTFLRDVAADELGLELSTTDTFALLGDPLDVFPSGEDILGRIARVASERRLDHVLPKDPEKLHNQIPQVIHEEPKGEDND
tara:strand:+ start:420 stop:800 length:381 start_codon:yes stop_codon:yes gene_type:complete